MASEGVYRRCQKTREEFLFFLGDPFVYESRRWGELYIILELSSANDLFADASTGVSSTGRRFNSIALSLGFLGSYCVAYVFTFGIRFGLGCRLVASH